MTWRTVPYLIHQNNLAWVYSTTANACLLQLGRLSLSSVLCASLHPVPVLNYFFSSFLPLGLSGQSGETWNVGLGDGPNFILHAGSRLSTSLIVLPKSPTDEKSLSLLPSNQARSTAKLHAIRDSPMALQASVIVPLYIYPFVGAWDTLYQA
jgi:hypothetical protein